MPNRLLKYKNLAPLLEDELFVRAISLNSADQYRDKLSWDEKNRYAGFYPEGARQASAMIASGVLLLTTPAKVEGDGVVGTSANIVKLFDEPNEPFIVLGVETFDGVINLKNSVVEFGRYKNLEDAARVAIAIHQNDSFEIPNCLDEKPDTSYPERPAAVKERRDREYVDTMQSEIKGLENRILDRKIWLEESRRNLARLDPDGDGEKAYFKLHEVYLETPEILNDPGTASELQRLLEIHQLSNSIRLNDLSRKDEIKMLEKTQHRHDAFVERTYGHQTQEPNYFSRVI